MRVHPLVVSSAIFISLAPSTVKAQTTEGLEISVTSVTRENEMARSGTKTITISFELINRGQHPLYVAMCCTDYSPLIAHNPAVEQLMPDGKWEYVGGAYSDLPAPIWKKLEPSSQIAQDITITDPYRMLSVPGGFDLRPGYSQPINGLHRLRIRYSDTVPFDAHHQRKTGSKIVEGYSKSFEISPANEADGHFPTPRKDCHRKRRLANQRPTDTLAADRSKHLAPQKNARRISRCRSRSFVNQNRFRS